MANKVKIIISWLLVFATMAIIFYFSSQNSRLSTSASEDVIHTILGSVMDSDQITPGKVQRLQLPIRKIAHFGIYMLLGFCLANAFTVSFSDKKWLNYIFSLLLTAIYAVSDEIHQSFIDGRWAYVSDVLIDALGGLIGILLFIILLRLINFSSKLKIKKHSVSSK